MNAPSGLTLPPVARLHERRVEEYSRVALEAWLDSLETDGFGHWLAGFVAGEGSFLINRVNPKDGVYAYSCTFRIQLRSDDREILELMRRRVGLGTIKHRPDRQEQQCASRPASYWTIRRKSDVALLVPLFERFPMRAKKGVCDFPIWREAVRVWTQGPIYARPWEEMAQLKRQLEAVRVYSAAPASEQALQIALARADEFTK